MIPIGIAVFPIVAILRKVIVRSEDERWIGPVTSAKFLMAWTMYLVFVALGLKGEISHGSPSLETIRSTSFFAMKDILI